MPNTKLEAAIFLLVVTVMICVLTAVIGSVLSSNALYEEIPPEKYLELEQYVVPETRQLTEYFMSDNEITHVEFDRIKRLYEDNNKRTIIKKLNDLEGTTNASTQNR